MRYFLSLGGWNRRATSFSSSLLGGTSEFRDTAESAWATENLCILPPTPDAVIGEVKCYFKCPEQAN